MNLYLSILTFFFFLTQFPKNLKWGWFWFPPFLTKNYSLAIQKSDPTTPDHPWTPSKASSETRSSRTKETDQERGREWLHHSGVRRIIPEFIIIIISCPQLVSQTSAHQTTSTKQNDPQRPLQFLPISAEPPPEMQDFWGNKDKSSMGLYFFKQPLCACKKRLDPPFSACSKISNSLFDLRGSG